MARIVNSWQDQCSCGNPKNRYAVECQQCHLKNRKDTCVCGKPKYKSKLLCRDCNHKRDFCTCGLTKDKRSLACTVCRGKEPLEKKCNGRCGRVLLIELYNLRPDGKGGHKRRSRCRECESQEQKERNANFPEKAREIKRRCLESCKKDPIRAARAQRSQWRRQWLKLGLDPDEVFQWVDEHGWVCAICGEVVGHRTRAADHNHTTGKFRGVLCSRCNLGLGLFKDSPDLFRKAAEYLDKS